ncbi:MAG: hypothetical protein NWR78_05700 [Aquiluna sp.]|nr:hypothetical protein [Aquiluna sp.]
MKMNRKVIAATAVSAVLVGGLAFAAPGLAHGIGDRDRDSRSESQHSEGAEHSRVTLESSITQIPSEVTELRDAVRGAHFKAYMLDSAVLPVSEPAEGGRFVGIRPERAEDGTMVLPEISDGSLTANLGLKAGATEGISYYALYPSDGSEPTLVTITVDAAGIATASASKALTVSYDAEVAAAAPEMGPRGKRGGHGEGHGKGKGHREMRGEHDENHSDDSNESDD